MTTDEVVKGLQKCDTPTDVIAKAFKAQKADLVLYFPDKIVTVKGNELAD